MDATFRFSHLPPMAKLTIDGELDPRGRAQLVWRLRDLEGVECDAVRLDVGRLNYIDHECMGLIDETRRRLVARGVDFQVGAASLCFALVSGLGGYAELATLAEQAREVPELRTAG